MFDIITVIIIIIDKLNDLKDILNTTFLNSLMIHNFYNNVYFIKSAVCLWSYNPYFILKFWWFLETFV